MKGDSDPMVTRPSPTAEGNLSRTPFAHVLLYIRERKLTGTLAVHCTAEVSDLIGESLLTFEHGELTQVRLPRVLDPLGVLLHEHGRIHAEQLEESRIRLAAREGLQGEILVAMGACDHATIEWGLRLQLRRKTLRLFALREAPYQFYADCDLLAHYGGRPRPHADVLSVLWHGIRANPDSRTIDGVLAKVGAQRIRLRSESALSLFGFGPDEEAVIQALRQGSVSIDSLLCAGLDPNLVRALVYTLLISKQVDIVPAPASVAPSRASESQAPSSVECTATPHASSDAFRPVTGVRPAASQSGHGKPTIPSERPAASKFGTRLVPSERPVVLQPSPSEPPLPPEWQARLVEAQQRLAEMQDQNYFQMLGVPTDASSDAVRSAFLEVAANWHPDRLPPHLGALRAVYQQIFALLSEAQATLTDDDARKRYLATVQDGGGTPNAQRRIAALIEAATDVQKAEICLKRKEYTEAERLARCALQVNPEDPDALVVLANVLLERQTDGPFDEALALLTRAVNLAPQHDRAHTLLGRVYQRMGDPSKALDHFKLAVEANPKNIDAAREVRLAEIRARNSSASMQAANSQDRSDSMIRRLSKLFKKQ